jgi:hypothetical protein
MLWFTDTNHSQINPVLEGPLINDYPSHTQVFSMSDYNSVRIFHLIRAYFTLRPSNLARFYQDNNSLLVRLAVSD